MIGKHARRRLALAVTAVALLGGCDTWFGDRETPLPGERISVLLHERALEPDPELANEEILLPPPTPNPAWPQDGGYANHAMHHIEIADEPARAWATDVGTGADEYQRIVSSPVVAHGRVFTLDADAQVTAVDAESGRHLWQRDLTPDDEDDGHFGGGLATDGARLYATTGFGQVFALNAATGEVVWTYGAGGPLRTPPSLRGGRLFVSTVDNRLIALDSRDGTQLWIYEGFSEVASLLGGGSPAVDDGLVVMPLSTGEIVALKAETGQQLWSDSLAATRRSQAVAALADIRGRPVIDRGVVLAVSHSGLMSAFDLRSGRRLWEQEVSSLEGPWVAGDYVFVLTPDAELAALSRRNGRIYWVTPLPRYEDPEDREGRILWTGPILVSDRLVVAGSAGQALAVSPYTGDILGAIELPDGVSVAPVVADGTVYFLSNDAELVAYR